MLYRPSPGSLALFKISQRLSKNTSCEFSLNTTILKTKYITWTTAVNLTIPRNKLVAFPNLATSTYANDLFIGHPLSASRQLHSLGVDPESGIYIFADANGKPTSTPDYNTDRTVIINTLPKFYGGLQNSISYKGIQLDLLFQFVKQLGANARFNSGSRVSPGEYNRFSGGNQPTSILSCWQKPGDFYRYTKILYWQPNILYV